MHEYQILKDISLMNVNGALIKYVPHPEGLFVLLVEGSDNDHKHRTDPTLQETEEEALGVELLVVAADDGQNQTDAPDGHNARRDTLNGEALSKVHGRIGSDDETEVEDGCRHRVPVACSQVQIIAKSKQSLADLSDGFECCQELS